MIHVSNEIWFSTKDLKPKSHWVLVGGFGGGYFFTRFFIYLFLWFLLTSLLSKKYPNFISCGYFMCGTIAAEWAPPAEKILI